MYCEGVRLRFESSDVLNTIVNGPGGEPRFRIETVGRIVRFWDCRNRQPFVDVEVGHHVVLKPFEGWSVEKVVETRDWLNIVERDFEDGYDPNFPSHPELG